MSGCRVLPYYFPPTLLLRQLMALITISFSTGWKVSKRWIRDLKRLLKVAAGATHYGCFGYAVHPVYEVTSMCNLRCMHCHARGGEPYPGELDTEKAKLLIENLTTVKEFRMLVFTGGEPLVRKDIFELTEHAVNLGFNVVYATNATLIDKDKARKMERIGVLGAAVSIDSINPRKHDLFRGVNGAWKKCIEGIKNLLDYGLYLQINITASKLNYNEIPDLIRFSDKLGAHVILLYNFVASGRGEEYSNLELSISEYLNLVKTVAELQSEVELVIVPVALPWYYASIISKSKLPVRIVKNWVTGCIAARGMFYIKPNGDVWPCAFLPIKAGNVVNERAIDVWNSEIFKKIRDRENLKGACKNCKYREICGGCRSRAYISTGDPFAEDPTCGITKQIKSAHR